MSNTIVVCLRCGTPLISTLKFSKAEWFCAACAEPFGLIEGKRVLLNYKLEVRYDEAVTWFDEQAVGAIAIGERRTDCPQCDTGDDHLNHVDDETRKASEEAYKRLLLGMPTPLASK